MVGKLLDLYRNDPDSGIHGAAEWTLRRWKEQEKLKELDAQLMKLKDRGDRRWFVNSQGQTFAVIEGPVEFRMGSPATEPSRNETMEKPRRVVIPRRFAIAAKEVTVDQWLRFERTHAGLGLPPSFVKKFSPGPDGPMIGFTWYIAAEYCNWLSEQEGLPKDQWCYLPNEAGAYAEGMTIPADVLERTGYRLPTEAEWEYRLPLGHGHQLLFRRCPTSFWRSMPGIRPTARNMPGRAVACCRTTWGCSTCWGTSLNGCKIVCDGRCRKRRD